MRFLCIVKGDKTSESGALPTVKEFAAMGAFNATLITKGLMEAGEGLHPTSKGARIHYENGTTTVTKGPFAEPKPFSGFWIIKANSLDEAVALMRQSPNPSRGPGEVEIRPIYSPEDFGDALTPEFKAAFDKMAKEAKKNAGK